MKEIKAKNNPYNDLAKFINKSTERRFNDALIRLIVIEIQLKSFQFNENTILPRYFNKNILYNGEMYLRSAFVKDLVPNKAIQQIKILIKKGCEMNFKNREQLLCFISNETEIKDGCLFPIFE